MQIFSIRPDTHTIALQCSGKLSEKYLHRQHCLLTLWFFVIKFLPRLLPRISFQQTTFYANFDEDRDKSFVAETAPRGVVEIVRPKSVPLWGANSDAFSPVKTSSTDWPFKSGKCVWNTFCPKGWILLRQLVCMKTLEDRLQYRFSTLSSSWAEIPSKSPTNFKWMF